jgi:hypothetical protein
MVRSLVRRKRLLVVVLVLAIMGPAYAVLNFTPSGVAAAAVPFGPAPFVMPLTINPGLYSDQILAVEIGRDDGSPYVAIVVRFQGGANNPTPNPIFAAMGPWWPTFPGGAPQPVPGYPMPGGTDVILRFVYRPTNDPANPGWMGLAWPPGAPPPVPAPGQLDWAWQTCAAVAAQLDAFRAPVVPPPIVPTPLGPVPVQPWIYLEFDPNGANPSFLECFKLHIVR